MLKSCTVCIVEERSMQKRWTVCIIWGEVFEISVLCTIPCLRGASPRHISHIKQRKTNTSTCIQIKQPNVRDRSLWDSSLVTNWSPLEMVPVLEIGSSSSTSWVVHAGRSFKEACLSQAKLFFTDERLYLGMMLWSGLEGIGFKQILEKSLSTGCYLMEFGALL